MKVTGCGAQMQRLMDVSVDDVVAIENSLGRRVEMGEAKKDAQVNAVGDAILELELRKRALTAPKESGRYIDSPDDIDGLGNFNLDAGYDLSRDELEGSYNPDVEDIDISPNLDTTDLTTTKTKIKAAVNAYGYLVEEGFKKPSFAENEYGDLVSRVKAAGKLHDFVVQPDGNGWRVLTRSVDFGGRGAPISFGGMSGAEVTDFIRRHAAAMELNKQKFDLLSTVDKDATDRLADYWLAVGQTPKALELTMDTEPELGEKPTKALVRIANERAGALGMTAQLVGDGKVMRLYLESEGDEHSVEIELIKGLHKQAVTVHASGLNKGSGIGKVVYSVIGSWAAERDILVVADVDGLTAVNAVRRTENGLSAAARGNDSMVPGVAQRVYGYNDKPKGEEDARKNLARLAIAQLRNVLELAPEAADLTYIPETGKFDDEAMLTKLIQRPEVRKNSLGRTSFARAALTARLLEGAEIEVGDFAKPVMYSERTQGGEFSATLASHMDTDGWLKAPNGKDTALSPEQWVAARTPSFVQWFGNWELAAKTGDPTLRLAGGLDANGEPLGVYFADAEDVKPVYPAVVKGGVKIKSPAARRSDMRPATDEDMARLKIPRAFEYPMVAMDETNADLLWVAVDASGRRRYGYKAEYEQGNMLVKFQRMQRFYQSFPQMIDRIKRDSVSGNEQAMVMRLIALTGFRIGGESSGRVESYGASSLEPRHVEVQGDTLVFNFTGKSGVKQSHAVSDDVLARVIETRYNQPKIFDTTDDRVRKYLRTVDDEFKVHDFRTNAATRSALAVVKSTAVPANPEEFWAAYDAAIEAGAKRIGDTRDVAESTYIDPSVFTGWRESAGVPIGSKKPRNTRRIRGQGAGKPTNAGLDAGNDGGVLRESKREAVEEFLSVKRAYDDLLTGDAKDVTLEQFSELTDRSIAAKANLVEELASADGLVATTPDGRMLTLTPSAQKPGQWQLTRFARDNTPWGDTNYATREQAIGDFVEEADVSTMTDSGGTPVASPEVGESKREDRPVDLPDAVVRHPLGAANGHPDYAAAKGGDIRAAARLAADLVDAELLNQVRAMGGDVIVPVASIEASGRNKIPTAAAAAAAIARGVQADMETEIVQSNAPKRTSLAGVDRIFNTPEFDGAVRGGARYVLVDDTLTQGATFASLASHIRAGGGEVVGVVALTGKQYSAKLALSNETLKQLRAKHGDIEQDFRDAVGYGFAALTESEASYIANFKPVESIRDRIIAAGVEGRRQAADGGVSGPTKNPSFSKREQALIDRISADGITSPNDLRDLLRMPGFGKRKKSAVMQDPARAQTLRSDLEAAFPGTAWQKPRLNDQGLITVHSEWNGLSQESLEQIAGIADANDAPVVVRGFDAERLDFAALGFTPYWGVQQMDGRHFGVKIAHIRPGGGITNTTPMFSERDSLGYYSELEDKVAESTMKQAPAAAWKTFIKALTQKGVKPDEIEWSGVMEWLDGQIGPQTHEVDVAMISSKDKEPKGFGVYLKGVDDGDVVLGPFLTRKDAEDALGNGKIKKEDLVAYLEQGGVRVQETVLSGEPNNAPEWGMLNDERSDAPKYGKYTLPGGERYREVLLTLPTKTEEAAPSYDSVTEFAANYVQEQFDQRGVRFADNQEQVDLMKGDIWAWTELWMDAAKQHFSVTDLRASGFSGDRRIAVERERVGAYKSPHWDQPNVIAHLRINDRTDVDGNSVMFVEEIQSDYGQDIKKKGAAGTIEAALKVNGMTRAEFDAMPAEDQQFAIEETKRMGLPPAAPFVKNTDGWLSLALKRVITMAVEGGYDKVAFVNGEQSADRYDLSKQIDRIEYERLGGGKYAISAYGLTGGKVVDEVDVGIDRVEELVGKEITNKIQAGEGLKSYSPILIAYDGDGAEVFRTVSQRDMREFAGVYPGKLRIEKSAPGEVGSGILSGLDLKVGGEGMKTFYDSIVPQAAKKLISKMDGKMEEISVLADPNAELDLWEAEDGLGDGSKAPVEQLKQPGFTITKKMRDSVVRGLPRFSDRPTLDKYMEGRNRSMPTISPASVLEADIALAVKAINAVEKAIRDGNTTMLPVPIGRVPHAISLAFPGRKMQKMLRVDTSILKKVLFDKHSEDFADVSVEEFVRALYQPAMVLKGRSDNEFEIVTSLVNNDKGPIIVPVVDSGNSYAVMSAYAKPVMGGGQSLMKRIKSGLLYADPELAQIAVTGQRSPTQGIVTSGAQFPSAPPQGANKPNVPYTGLVVKPRNANYAGWGLLRETILGGIRDKKVKTDVDLMKRIGNLYKGDVKDAPSFSARTVMDEWDDEAGWVDYAKRLDAFQFGNSPKMRSKSLSDIAEAFSTPTLKITQDTSPIEDGVQLIVNGNRRNGSMSMTFHKSDGKYVIGASDANGEYGNKSVESQGQRMYQVLFAYAHNNGFSVDADLALSYINGVRRTSAMLSSALRFGTTDHFGEVGEEQNVDRWKEGGYVEDVEALALAEARKTQERIPDFHSFSINPKTGEVSSDRKNQIFSRLRIGEDAPVDSGLGGVEQGGVGGKDSSGSPGTLRRKLSRGQDAVRERDARSTDRGLEGDVHNKAGSAVPMGKRASVQKKAFTDQELARYLASVGGGFEGHGVGVVTLKRALLTKQGDVGGFGGLLYSRRAGTSSWDEPMPSKWDDYVFKLQDKLVDLKRVIQDITKWTGALADDINVYLQEELFHGRAAKRVQDFARMELNPALKELADNGLQLADLEEYMHARHAKEANRVIAQRNPNEPGLQDGGSGMKDADADAYFRALSPVDSAKLSAAAAKFDAIMAETNRLMVEYELESQDTINSWGTMFQHYVPLHREDKEGGSGMGQGYSVKGKETKGRTGSTRKVVDIISHIAMAREKTVVRGEKNRVAKALVGLVTAHPNQDFWKVGPPDYERVFNPKTGLVEERINPMYKNMDNVVVAKALVNGKVTEVVVTFNEDSERAVRLAGALKNLDAPSLEGLWGAGAKVTRYFASINTQYNPVFGIVNLVRDIQGAMINLSATPLSGMKGRISKDAVLALAGIYKDIRATRKGGVASSSWSALYEQFQEDGGQTGFRDLFKTADDRTAEMNDMIDPEAWARTGMGRFFSADGKLVKPMNQIRKGSDLIFDWLSDYNEAMENSVRLAAYKAALDRGMSRQQAASLAKNLTVNFNRKGQAGVQAGAVWAFFNAAMQGTARLAETLVTMEPGKPSTVRLSPLGKKIVYGGMLLGSMQALALAAAGFGEDEPPQFLRERSLIIPTGGKGYITIPMPLGFHVIPSFGRIVSEFALDGFSNPQQRAAEVIGLFADAFNPIGNAGLSMQTIAPTALDPLVALTENKDWTGRPIAKLSFNRDEPGFENHKDTATWVSKTLAEMINTLSGGNKYVAGVMSPTPDQLDYLGGQLGGGVWRELSKVEQTLTSSVTGEDLPLYKIPVVGRFVGTAGGKAGEAGQFYANANKLNRLETEIKGLEEDGKKAEANELRRQPQALLIAKMNSAERELSKLRKQKSAMLKADAPRENVVAVEERITAVMARMNRAMEARAD